MPAVSMRTEDVADLAELIRDLRDWIDAEDRQLDPLLTKHGFDIIGLRVDLDRFTALLTTSSDGEPSF